MPRRAHADGVGVKQPIATQLRPQAGTVRLRRERLINLRRQPAEQHVVVAASEELVIAVAAEQIVVIGSAIERSFPAPPESPKGGRLNCDARSATILVTAVLN